MGNVLFIMTQFKYIWKNKQENFKSLKIDNNLDDLSSINEDLWKRIYTVAHVIRLAIY